MIPARIEHLMPAARRTALRNGTLSVETVEHCLAACTGLGVRNAEIELTQSSTGELPMGDGSSQAFVDAIEEAGVEEQPGEVRPLVIREPNVVRSEGGDATLAALPGPEDHLEIVYTFEAPAPLGRQVFCFHLYDSAAADDFRRDVAPARTFIFEKDVQVLHERGLGRHLNYSDLVVIGETGPIDNKFRFPDECVRHKVLDLIGDLSLVGRPIFGRIVAHKSGHTLNHTLSRRLLEVEATDALARIPDTGHVESVAPDYRQLIGRPAAEAALDIRKIQRILPHRFPMLLVDRVLKIEGDQRAIGLKNITMGDVFFLGHYPGAPIFPGVLIVEAMAQLGGILLSRKLDNTGKLAVLLSMDNVKMRQPVVPGDQLILEAEAVRVKSRTGHVRCSAYVCEKLAAEADIKFMLVDAETE
jgi:UDP-3-O-[3-hydroxymyristoyl] N-acetylglucosamine deacetylase/3-hydroxyacyl-[acyl-carrier-protein] dehydratase